MRPDSIVPLGEGGGESAPNVSFSLVPKQTTAKVNDCWAYSFMPRNATNYTHVKLLQTSRSVSLTLSVNYPFIILGLMFV